MTDPNFTTTRIRSARALAAMPTEVQIAYRDFYLAVKAFREDPSETNEIALEEAQTHVEEVEDLYHAGRLLLLQKKVSENG